MIDCSMDILAFHNEAVTLTRPERTEMRDHRDKNRTRLRTRLGQTNKPVPSEFIKQGSYAMHTMVQDSENDYDIDDGVYYKEGLLIDSNGDSMAPEDVRRMICDSLKDDRFNRQPQVKNNCARVFYEEGYHVDMPVYKIREADGEYELATGSQWSVSRAADVEDWFRKINIEKSPDELNGRQFRRIVRILKKFARSRKAWKSETASGFAITVLASKCYSPNANREDISVRETMQCIYDHLLITLEVDHPVTAGAWLTNGPDDSNTKFFREKLGSALVDLGILDDSNCTREQALNAWDKVFNTELFSERNSKITKAVEGSGNDKVLANLIATQINPPPVDKQGGGRLA